VPPEWPEQQPSAPRPILFANGKKWAQLASDAQDNAN